jgi:hypothetical protein
MALILNRSLVPLACPFFMPVSPRNDGGWLHPSRLPLGGGWSGHCCAPGHEGSAPSNQELREFCNLGYATDCERLPNDRAWDAVRFSIARDGGTRLVLWFVREAQHHPVDWGTLEYDASRKTWISSHPEARLQKMAECYLQSYFMRKNRSAPADSLSSTNP